MALSQPDQETLLLKQPTLSRTNIAFLYAGELWNAEQNGSHPQRLTAQIGKKFNPEYSPDGQWIAFSGNYDGNQSVYVIPRGGGSPRRLTYHPGEDFVRGWTPDGKQILFASARDSVVVRSRRLYTVPLEGGHPSALPMPTAERGSYSPDGQQIAYTPYVEAFWSWKRYRGGQTVPIWVFDLNTYEHIEIPHENASDTFPCWLGDSLYFLSDRCGVMNMFCYDLTTRSVRQTTFHKDFDVRSLTRGAGLLTYEQAGRVHIFDPALQQSKTLSIAISADLPATRSHYRNASHYIQSCGLSPTGARAVFEARGDILTVPVKKGEVRNLTRTPGVCERDPSWSPDGKSIAYFSDASGEYELVITDQKGLHKSTFDLGKRSFFYSPLWSPDSKKVAYTDKALRLAYLDLETKEIKIIDTDTFDHPIRSLNPSWSPDSQWLVYTKRLENHLRAVFLYHLPTAQIHQVTDGMSDTIDAVFSKDGKYIFFAASGNFGLNTGWLDMSSFERPVIRSLYVVVLSKDQPSPLAPESDEETEAKEEDKGKKDEDKEVETNPSPTDSGSDSPADTNEEAPAPSEGAGQKSQPNPETEGAKRPALVKIDLEGLDQRILTLPMPARDYCRLQIAEGKLFYLETAPYQPAMAELAPTAYLLNSYDLKERRSEVYLPRVRDYWVSADGKKILTRFNGMGDFSITSVDKKPDPGEGSLDLDSADILVNPIAEWQQMFREAYRIHRDYFYDPGMHGLDLEAAYQKYLEFLPHVGHRDDLNYLLAEFSGELVAGHAYVGFGDIPAPAPVSVGLLGADYEVVEGCYRIKNIYHGLNWIPELRAPLTEPGVNVQAGEYILAVNGETLRAPNSIYSLFQKTVDRITELSISPTPDETQARSVLVCPIFSETALRLWHWIETNRKKVDALTGGRVAYVYMSDTWIPGYESFNRYYFSQLNKQAVILDERFNAGGSVADYVIDLLDRPVLCYWATREGKEFASPNASIFGPKVMIINEMAGSGGDALPHFFRRRGLGKLVGKRTWGGLIGIFDYPALMDGGMFTSPRLAIYGPDGRWEVENEGVPPDIDVEFTPKLVIEGHDPQLEKAVEVVLEELQANPPTRVPRPAPAKRAEPGS